MSQPLCRKATPVLHVPRIEPSLAFWRDRLGFALTIEVPGEQGLTFAALSQDGIEVMLQTIGSLDAGVPWRDERSFLFIEVVDLAAVMAALADDEVGVAPHPAFYGATEVVYREPGAHRVTFAQFAADAVSG